MAFVKKRYSKLEGVEVTLTKDDLVSYARDKAGLGRDAYLEDVVFDDGYDHERDRKLHDGQVVIEFRITTPLPDPEKGV